VGEEATLPKLATYICDHENKESDDGREVKVGTGAEAVKDLNALLEVDEGDVEAEDVAWESSDPAEPIARVCDSQYPVK
jgi:hypothetical protein